MADKNKNKGKSNKTDAIMRLITGESAVNPILDNDFKEDVIASRQSVPGRAKKNAEIEQFRKNSVVIDVAAELVSEFLPVALKRFNCCQCPICFAEAMADALDAVPERKIKVRDNTDLKKADQLKKKSKHEILTILVRIAIIRRGFPIHSIKPTDNVSGYI